MNHLSLYSGIGGKDLAAHWAGMRTVALCDAEPYCRFVLRKNFPGVPIFEYDTEVTREALDALGVGQVDVISGGFPCQPWSLAGKQGGENDPRHRWPEMFRIITDLRPTWVLGENVRGLVSNGGLDAVCADLESVGYEVWPFVLPTGAAVGAPHKRERVIIVAHSQSQPGRQGGAPEGGRHLGRPSSGGDEVLADPASPRRPRGQPEAGEPSRHETRRERPSGLGDGGLDGDQRTTYRQLLARERFRIASLANPLGGGRDGREDAEGGGLLGGEASGRLEGADQHQCGSALRDADTDGTAQPGVGGGPDGVSRGLDRPRWPAGRGMEQYEWEAPRLTTRKHLRRERIKALGNSVVPYAVYPFYRAMMLSTATSYATAEQGDLVTITRRLVSAARRRR